MIVEQDLNSDEPLIGAGSRPDPVILSKDAIKYGGDGRSQIIPYEPNKGIYFLNDNILSFYSLENKTLTKPELFMTSGSCP
jgi:aspartate/methionine/tyrosine aminotransferase